LQDGQLHPVHEQEEEEERRARPKSAQKLYYSSEFNFSQDFMSTELNRVIRYLHQSNSGASDSSWNGPSHSQKVIPIGT
jgi:hypothetical protein